MDDETSFAIEERAGALHPGGRFVVLFFPDAGQAQTFIDDVVEYPDSPILTPGVENTVYPRIVSEWGVEEDLPC